MVVWAVGQDYTQLDRVAELGAVFLIYYDFGVLSNHARDELLSRVLRTLKPGGNLVFDVVTNDKIAVCLDC